MKGCSYTPFMSEEQLKAFLEKVKDDTSLQVELEAAADTDAVVEIAKTEGFSISADDVNDTQPTELTEDELEGLTGGQCLKDTKLKCSWR